MSDDSTEHDKASKYLATLTADSECFGLLGVPEHAGSFYKVYVRARPGERWWKAEREIVPVDFDPIQYQAEIPLSGRTAAVWCPLRWISCFEHHPKNGGLRMLFDRSRSVAGGDR